MFNTTTQSKKRPAKKTSGSIPNDTFHPNSQTNVIAQGTKIEGTFRTTEDLRVDGQIIGDVHCNNRFVMGETGLIDGTVECKESTIKGTIEGSISVKGLLHLLSSAVIKGKIIAKKMIVDEGAAYNGECLIGEQNFKEN